jgi:hypothetical protein
MAVWKDKAFQVARKLFDDPLTWRHTEVIAKELFKRHRLTEKECFDLIPELKYLPVDFRVYGDWFRIPDWPKPPK